MSAEPLKPAAFHILLALADGDSHGYAIMQAVREQSAGRVPLQTGSFYRHLTRLIDLGLVAEAPAPRSVEDPRRGTHYRLPPNDAGARAGHDPSHPIAGSTVRSPSKGNTGSPGWSRF